MLGVDLYALSNYPAAQVQTYGEHMLAYIKHVLKADAVGIVWNFYAPSISSDAVKATDATLSARNVAILTRIALRDHLLVQYRPLILVPKAPSPWEGQITPYFQPKWFDNYYRAELPYLKVAQHFHVREFVTGTELAELNSTPLWSSFFARVSRVYHGSISYSAWDGNYFGVSPGFAAYDGQATASRREVRGHGYVLARQNSAQRYPGAGHRSLGVTFRENLPLFAEENCY